MFYILRKYRRIILTSSLVLCAAFIISSNAKENNNLFLFEEVIYAISSPLQKTISFTTTNIDTVLSYYIFLINLKKENTALKKKNNLLKEKIFQLREMAIANTRLRTLLRFREEVKLPMIPAEVVAYDPSSWFKTILINKGSNNNIAKNMPIVTSDGILGRVMEVSKSTARLLLITDHRSAVDAIVQRTRAKGILVGNVDKTCNLKYVFRSDDVNLGDYIISSGLGGIFPKGLPLGKVSRIKKDNYGMFQEVKVTPMVSFNKLEELFIVVCSN